MQKLLVSLMIIALPLMAAGQQYQLLPNFYRPLDPSELADSKPSPNDPVNFSMEVGTGFTGFGGQSALQSYVAPSVDYQVNSNLTLNFTGVLANTNTFSGGAPAKMNATKGLMANTPGNNAFAISGEGIYQPNERFYIRAGGEYAENSMQPFQLYPSAQQSPYSNDYKSFHFGMGYKISENSSINFQMQFSEGYHPLSNPYSPHHVFRQSHRRFPW